MKPKKAAVQALKPGDYYINEQGLMVFTQQYHLRRGYCCGSGCKHCPWRKEASERPSTKQASGDRPSGEK